MSSTQFRLEWVFLQVFIFYSVGNFHIFVLRALSFRFFSSFFCRRLFFNLRVSNPTAISKMSIIVSLKKL